MVILSLVAMVKKLLPMQNAAKSHSWLLVRKLMLTILNGILIPLVLFLAVKHNCLLYDGIIIHYPINLERINENLSRIYY
ncbi:hypothetical protein CJ20_235 [Escherichia phage CJ20]|nr:hypothetical protein CJ20_235 [Escherichia phage CJ20]